MKKWFCALGMMLALLMSVALADGVKVTFAEIKGHCHFTGSVLFGGNRYFVCISQINPKAGSSTA